MIFINAWSELAEGCHLEPDLKWGRQYLEATKAAVDHVRDPAVGTQPAPPTPGRSYPRAKRMYWKGRAFLAEQRDLLNNIIGRQG